MHLGSEALEAGRGGDRHWFWVMGEVREIYWKSIDEHVNRLGNGVRQKGTVSGGVSGEKADLGGG
jgi:hypothetical protein